MIKLAEFLAEVGFKADGASLKSALKQVATFGAGIATAATGAIAGLLKIAQGEAQLADEAEKLQVPVAKLEELRFVAEQSGASAEALSSSLEGLKKANPGIRDAEKLLAKAGRAMAGMNDEAARLYAQKMGIDPSLIPMLRDEATGLTKDFHAMYAASGRDAAKAAADGKALMQEFGRLKSLFELLVKTVAGAFPGKVRGSFELLRKSVVENFDKIRKALEFVIGIVLRAGDVIAAFVYRIIKFASAIIGWFDRLDDGTKKLIVGIGLLAAAWKLLNAGFLATPLGKLIAGLTLLFALVDDYQTWAEGGDSLFDWGPAAETIETVTSAIGKGLEAVKNFCVEHKRLLKALATGIAATLAVKKAMGAGAAAFKLLGGSALGTANVFRMLWGILRANPLGILITAAALIIEYWEPIKEFFSNIWVYIEKNFPDFGAWAKNAVASICNAFSGLFSFYSELCSGILDFFRKLFSGDISGALDAAKNIFLSWINGISALFSNLGNIIAGIFSSLWGKVKAAFPDLGALAANAVSAITAAFGSVLSFFSSLWGSVVSAFPDFGAWAGKAADSIKNLLGNAIGWVKDKLSGLVSFLPDWVKKKIGLKDSGKDSGGKEKNETGAQEPQKSQQAPRMSPYMQRPIPSGPALVPTPMQKESVVNKNTEVKVDSRTQITVNGTQNPEAVANKVAGAQNSVAADIARNTQGAVR